MTIHGFIFLSFLSNIQHFYKKFEQNQLETAGPGKCRKQYQQNSYLVQLLKSAKALESSATN